MRVAIVGAGSLGTVHAHAAASLPGVRVTRVADVDRDRASALAGAVGALASVDAAEVVGRDDVDAVVVAVPTDRHREVVELAAASGKHVFCEKPLALTLPDARDMIAACDRSGVRLMAGQVVRFFPEYARIGALLREGAVGRVATVRARRLNVHPGSHRSWYADPARSGGLILDLMIHDLDTLRWYLGEAERVMAHDLSARPTHDTLDFALATVRFRGGEIAHVEASWAHQGFRTSIEVAGDAGLLRHDSQEGISLRTERPGGQGDGDRYLVPTSPSGESPYRAELRHFFDRLADGQPFLTPGGEAAASLALALAVRESARTGQPVEPEPVAAGYAAEMTVPDDGSAVEVGS